MGAPLNPATTLAGLLVFFTVLGMSACDDEQPAATPQDVSGECTPTCVDTYALAYDFGNGCLPSNNAEIFVGCLPIDPCTESYSMERHCFISPERDAIIIDPEQISHVDAIQYLKDELGWIDCEDVIVDEYWHDELIHMFQVCD